MSCLRMRIWVDGIRLASSSESDPYEYFIATANCHVQSQWNTAFGTPSTRIVAVAAPGSQPPLSSPANAASTQGPLDIPRLNEEQQQSYQFAASMAPLPQVQQVSQPASYHQFEPSFVSPSMWRDTVASTYDPGGLKRRWDVRSSFVGDPMQTNRSR